ncbi:Ras-related protein Ral-A [Paragonimus westermani]|uniref:Ras-related protein Ral-A n=1 Tax=Paragonimus westermani TaxID=34504 RepID=A0A5J4NXW0_9TREM|nr:Ras-related protein Ral-A [Paragonimus westermani]
MQQQQQQPAPIVRIIMVGAGGVGKSALTLRFMYDEFVEDYEPTKADSYRKKIVLDGDEVQIDILDTAGQEDYFGVRDVYLRAGEGFLLVYAVDEMEGLKELSAFIEHIVRIKGTDKLPMIVIANKVDLRGTTEVYLVDAGKDFARQHNIEFVETSAKMRLNVDFIFQKLARDIRQRQLALSQRPKQATTKKPRKRCTIL